MSDPVHPGETLRNVLGQLRHAYANLIGAPAPQIRAIEALLVQAERIAEPTGQLCCMDCGTPYADFPLDVNLPRAQWLAIHSAENGVLCAQCIVRRIKERIPGVIVCHMIAEVAPHSPTAVIP